MTPKVFDRIYSELKGEVTSGRYKPGQRLQARTLAETLKVSTSPITNAMRQLVGEDVLEYTAEDGFIVPWVNERRLRDLFAWTSWLTGGMLNELEGLHLAVPPSTPGLVEDPIVGATEALMFSMAELLQNGELTRSVTNNNDRLRSMRLLERHLFPDRSEELATLVELWKSENRPALRRAFGRYHKRRLDAIAQFLGLSYPDRR